MLYCGKKKSKGKSAQGWKILRMENGTRRAGSDFILVLSAVMQTVLQSGGVGVVGGAFLWGQFI